MEHPEANDAGSGQLPTPFPPQTSWNWELTRFKFIHWLLTSNGLLRSLQGAAVAIFLFAIYSAFTGPAKPEQNFGMTMFWTLWWSPLMILSLLIFGRIWCYICPLGAIVTQIQKISLGRRFPTIHQRWYGVSALILSGVMFTLARLPLFKFRVASTPVLTGWYFTIFLVTAIGVTLLTDRRAWCRHICPATGVMSAVSKLAPIEFRHDLEKGVGGCITAEWQGNYLSTDKRCVYCMECTQSRPGAAVRLGLRWPGSALLSERFPVWEEAVLALIVFAVFPVDHVLSKYWAAIPVVKASGPIWSKVLPYYFSILITIAGFAFLTAVSAGLARRPFGRLFSRLGGAYVAMGAVFSAGQAVNSILTRGGAIGNGIVGLFGAAGRFPEALVSKETAAAWGLVSNSWLIVIAAAWSLLLLYRISRQEAAGLKAWAIFLPHLVALVPLNYFIMLTRLGHVGH